LRRFVDGDTREEPLESDYIYAPSTFLNSLQTTTKKNIIEKTGIEDALKEAYNREK
jgi:hypothetical protein